MINPFKKPKIIVVRDEKGRVFCIQHDDDVDIVYKTFKNEVIDSGSLERRVSNLEVRMDTDNYTAYYDNSDIPILKKGANVSEPKIPKVLPDTVTKRGW